MNFGTLCTPFAKFGTSFIRFGTSIPIAIRTPHLITYGPLFHLGTYKKVIGGWFPPWDAIWNPWYILYKIWYIIYKIWYIKSYCYQGPYLITNGHYSILEPIRKWLEVDPHLGTHFETLGTSFTKFGTYFIKFSTSTPNATETPMLSSMVHYIISKPIRKLLEVNSHLGMHFETLSTSFTKFGTTFIKFGTTIPNATGTLILSLMVH